VTVQTDAVRISAATTPAPPAGGWRPWTILLPGVLALFWSALLILADGATAVMASWDTPMPGARWVPVGLAGHCLLGAASVALLATGLSIPARRRAAAIAAWLIIPVGFGWLLFLGSLVGMS
jgi:hypothetical protein